MIGLLAGMLLFASCGKPAEKSTQTPSPLIPTQLPSIQSPTRTPLPPPVTSEFPTGLFFHKHDGESFCVLQLLEDGTSNYFWMVPSTDISGRLPYVTSNYSIEGNLFHEKKSIMCSYPATYTWSYDGKALTFQVVGEDPCPDRQRTYETPLKYTRVD